MPTELMSPQTYERSNLTMCFALKLSFTNVESIVQLGEENELRREGS